MPIAKGSALRSCIHGCSARHQRPGNGRVYPPLHLQNASEVLRAGLRLLEQREREDTARLQALRDAVDAGISDLDAGRFATLSGPGEVEAYVAEIAAEPMSVAGTEPEA